MEQSPSNKHLIPLAIIAAGGLIASAIYFGGDSAVSPANVASDTNNPDINQIEIAPVTAADHILGNRNVPLVVIEYSDTECPFCKIFHSTMHQVVNTYDGRVAWVYRHFPIAQLHSKASKEAEATECAAELGGNQAFWNYTDKLFETTNSNNSLDPSELPKIARVVGLDETAFNTCLSSGKYAELVKKSVEEAVKAGARGTPHSIIIARDGRKVIINGAEPLASVKAKLDSLLPPLK